MIKSGIELLLYCAGILVIYTSNHRTEVKRELYGFFGMMMFSVVYGLLVPYIGRFAVTNYSREIMNGLNIILITLGVIGNCIRIGALVFLYRLIKVISKRDIDCVTEEG